MADELYKVLPDKVRYLEARVARLEDKVETIDAQRTTWLPGRSLGNMTGRQREILLVAVVVGLYALARKMARAPAAA